MTRRLLLGAVLLVALAAPVSAQLFGGIVYDPTNYANAVLRYGQLQQQLAQLVTTYQQIRTQYQLLWEQSQRLPVNMLARYRSLATSGGNRDPSSLVFHDPRHRRHRRRNRPTATFASAFVPSAHPNRAR